MKFLNVRAENFMSFEELDFTFPMRGLYFVGGEIVGGGMSNSNGAGKSVLFEALCFGLFGKTIRNAGKDDVINWNKKKDCLAEVILEDDSGENYIITRYRNHSEGDNDVRLFKGDQELTGSDTRETQVTLDGILGMNWLVFSTAVVFGEKAQRFAEAQEREKKEIFDDILMMGIYQEAQVTVKTDLRDLQTIRERIDADSSLAQAQLDLTKAELEAAEEALANVDKLKAETKKKIGLNEIDLDSALEAKKDAEKKYLEAKGMYDELEAENGTLYTYLETARKDEAKEMKTINKETFELRSLLSPIETKINEIEEWKNNSDSLPEGKRCSICGQIIDKDSVEGVLDHYEEELVELILESDKLKREQKILFEKETKLTLKWVEKSKKTELVKIDLDKELKKQNTDAQDKRLEVGTLDNEITLLRQSIENLKSSHEEQEKQLLQSKKRIEEKLDKYKNELKQLAKEAIVADDNMKYLDFWVEGFSNRGVKSLLLDEIIPNLNNSVSYYASALLDDQIRIEFDTEAMLKSGESRDKFNVKLFIAGQQVEYKSCSSGEKRRVDIAILLALQNLIFKRSAGSSNLIIFDEVFDSLDVIGIEKVVNLLGEEAQNKAIFVVSHSSEFRDYFNKEIIVKKENKVSRLEV